MQVKDDLVQNGKVTRGRIGVQIQDVNQALANSFGCRGPKARSSVAWNRQPRREGRAESRRRGARRQRQGINQLSELSGAIAATKPGNNARLQVWRDGKSRDVDVKVAELIEQKVAMNSGGDSQTSAKLGLTGARTGAGRARAAQIEADWWYRTLPVQRPVPAFSRET